MRLRNLLAAAAFGLAVGSAGTAQAQVPPARGEKLDARDNYQRTLLHVAAR